MATITNATTHDAGTPMTRKAFLGAAGAGTATLLAACGQTATDESPATDAAADATTEKVLRVGMINDKASWDLQKTNANASGLPLAVCETLMRFNENTEIEPLLITKMPDISDDGLTYSFELKDGVKFHDGSTLTSEDVKYSFERMFLPETKGTSTSLYTTMEGANEMLAGETTELSGFSIQDDRHFSIRLTRVNAVFEAVLSEMYALIYPHEACEAAGESWGNGTNLIGTGPFRLTANDDTTACTLERFDDYHDGAAKIDRIEVTYMSDANTMMMHFKAGDIDLCELDSSLYDQYSQDPDVKERIVPYTPAGTVFVCPNLNDPVLQDPRVREALSLAINRQELIDTVLSGAATPAGQFCAPGEEGHDDSMEVLPYDPERAKELLTEAGATGLTLTCEVTQPQENVAVVLQSYWHEIGVECEVQTIDNGVYTSERANGELQITVARWTTLCYVGAEHMRTYFHSGSSDKKSSFYANPDFDALIEGAEADLNKDSRIDKTIEADKLLTQEDYACIPVEYPWAPYVCADGLTGIYRIYTFVFTNKIEMA